MTERSKHEDIRADQDFAWSQLRAEQAQELAALKERHKREKEQMLARHKEQNQDMQAACTMQWAQYRMDNVLGTMSPEDFERAIHQKGFRLRTIEPPWKERDLK